MDEIWTQTVSWFFGLGEQYGVNPVIFGSIYVGAIPLFTVSVAWIVRNKRIGRPLVLPLISTGFWFISAYLYLFVAGENVPWWVYAVVLALLGYSGFASSRSIRAKLKANPRQGPRAI